MMKKYDRYLQALTGSSPTKVVWWRDETMLLQLVDVCSCRMSEAQLLRQWSRAKDYHDACQMLVRMHEVLTNYQGLSSLVNKLQQFSPQEAKWWLQGNKLKLQIAEARLSDDMYWYEILVKERLALTEALNVPEDSRSGMVNLAILSLHQQRLEQAESYLKHVLDLDPNLIFGADCSTARAEGMLAYIAIEKGDYSYSKTTYARLLKYFSRREVHDDYLRTLALLEDTFEEHGDFVAAQALLRLALFYALEINDTKEININGRALSLLLIRQFNAVEEARNILKSIWRHASTLDDHCRNLYCEYLSDSREGDCISAGSVLDRLDNFLPNLSDVDYKKSLAAKLPLCRLMTGYSLSRELGNYNAEMPMIRKKAEASRDYSLLTDIESAWGYFCLESNDPYHAQQHYFNALRRRLTNIKLPFRDRAQDSYLRSSSEIFDNLVWLALNYRHDLPMAVCVAELGRGSLLADYLNSKKEHWAFSDITSQLNECDEGTTLAEFLEPLRQKMQSVVAAIQGKANLIYFYQSRNHLYIMPLTAADNYCVTENIDGKSWEQSIREFYRLVRTPNRPPGDNLAALGEKMYNVLFSRIIDKLEPGLPTILVACGNLSLLPFSAIPIPNSPGQYLIDRFPLCLVPNLSVLEQLLHSELAVLPSAPTMLFIGRSDFMMEGLNDLPLATREFGLILALFGSRASGLIDEAATPSKLKEMVANFDCLTISTHGSVDTQQPHRSYLLLSADENNKKTLTFNDIVQGPFDRLGLVYLADCDSGAGSINFGESALSLAWAFMARRTPRVISSLWELNDALSRDAMEVFYRQLLDGHPAAVALQQAQIAIREGHERRFSDPYYWANLRLDGIPFNSSPAIVQ